MDVLNWICLKGGLGFVTPIFIIILFKVCDLVPKNCHKIAIQVPCTLKVPWSCHVNAFEVPQVTWLKIGQIRGKGITKSQMQIANTLQLYRAPSWHAREPIFVTLFKNIDIVMLPIKEFIAFYIENLSSRMIIFGNDNIWLLFWCIQVSWQLWHLRGIYYRTSCNIYDSSWIKAQYSCSVFLEKVAAPQLHKNLR